jgi:hypothetical protein
MCTIKVLYFSPIFLHSEFKQVYLSFLKSECFKLQNLSVLFFVHSLLHYNLHYSQAIKLHCRQYCPPNANDLHLLHSRFSLSMFLLRILAQEISCLYSFSFPLVFGYYFSEIDEDLLKKEVIDDCKATSFYLFMF